MNTYNTNPNCDGNKCRSNAGEVRLLPIGGDGNIIVCLACYESEMQYRRMSEPGVPVSLPSWGSLKVYGEEIATD